MAAVKPTTFKPNRLVPLKMELTSGTWYTLWAPVWVVRGEKWQAFLGRDDKISVFKSPAELHAYINSGQDHVLSDHPEWKEFQENSAQHLTEDNFQDISLIETPNYLSGRPSYEDVRDVTRGFSLLQSIGGVAGIESVNSWFGSYSMLQNIYRGAEHYAGESGFEEWTAVGRIVLGKWATMLDDVEAGLHSPSVDDDEVSKSTKAIEAAVSAYAATKAEETKQREAEEKAAADKAAEDERNNKDADPYDKTVWARVGIDPIKITMDGQFVYTLRCYLGDKPVFLGRHGQINTFPNSKALVRWLIDAPEHDLDNVATWGEVLQSANAGELEVTVHETNQYNFNGLVEDIAQSIEAVDTKQLGRAYEVLADAADWAEDDAVNKVIIAYPRLQSYLSFMLGAPSASSPSAPFDEEVKGWKQLEKDFIDRFTKF